MERTIYDNVPYSDIEEYIKNDLSDYGQDNPYPMSRTILLGNGGFRHYELGPIVGYVLIGEYNEGGELRTMISQIEEDDEFWFAPSRPLYMSGSWMFSMNDTLQRMVDWYKEHIFEGFVGGNQPENWKSELIKEIKAE